MASNFQRGRATDPWHGRQPRYEKLVTTGPTGVALITRLPNGKRVEVPLGTARRASS